MTYPTFNNGDPLPASDLNAIGLWLIKTQAVAAGGTSFTVTGAFSADYDNYKIVFANIGGASGFSVYMTINGSAGATYNYAGRFWGYALAAGDAALATTNLGFWLGIGGPNFSGSVEIQKPFLSTPTNMTVQSASSTYTSTGGNWDSNSASSTAFTVTLSGGTLTAGTVSVYGYKK
jgi:hypothetical protein